MNEYSQFSIRIKEIDKRKLIFIASNNSRSLNKQIEYLIKNAIAEYERVNKEIKITNNDYI